ncbi:hypothetical protein D3C76_1034130 [compost metagenome]
MNRANWPALSLSLYCSTLAAVMTNCGFSPSNGLPTKSLLTGAAPGFRPPLQTGMLPSVLPAFSAPNGVSVVPSWAASFSETAANTLLANRLSARVPTIKTLIFFMLSILCLWSIRSSRRS